MNETVLEMHYHKPLMDLFRDTFGLGPRGQMNFYKYSPQRECFVGFDQAYVKSDLSEDAFFSMLRNAASTANYRLEEFFVGYFLQFKVVKPMLKRNKYTPTAITRRSHYRVSLDTTRNVNTKLSQHELLYNLSRNTGALVYYACPMLFDRSALYDITVDLDPLRLADLQSCPSPYCDNDNHFLFFDDVATTPVWCSDPVEGMAVTPQELASAIVVRSGQQSAAQAAEALLSLLTNSEAAGLSARDFEVGEASSPRLLSLLAESLTVLRVAPGTPEDGERGREA